MALYQRYRNNASLDEWASEYAQLRLTRLPLLLEPIRSTR